MPAGVMSAREELEALDYEFNRPGSTMRQDAWTQRRIELSARADAEERAAKKAEAERASQAKPASKRFVLARCKELIDGIGEVMRERFAMSDKRAGTVERKLDSAVDLIADLERRVEALERRQS